MMNNALSIDLYRGNEFTKEMLNKVIAAKYSINHAIHKKYYFAFIKLFIPLPLFNLTNHENCILSSVPVPGCTPERHYSQLERT